jgi:hypothetical protein
VGVFALLLLAPVQAVGASPVDPIVAAQQAPPGPDVPTAPTEQDAATAKNRLVVGVAAVVLLGIVVLGRRMRSKRKKDSGGS